MSLGGFLCSYVFILKDFGKKYFFSVNSVNPGPKGKPATKEKYAANVEVSPKENFAWCTLRGWGGGSFILP